MEGFRWHYSEGIRNLDGITNVKAVQLKKGPMILKYEVGGSWYHLNQLWGFDAEEDTSTPGLKVKNTRRLRARLPMPLRLRALRPSNSQRRGRQGSQKEVQDCKTSDL